MVMTDEMEYTSRELERWLIQAGQGDRDALNMLYRAAAPAVYAYALSILKNQHDAEDVLHDCFMTVQEQGRQYKPQGKAMAWLMTVTRNLCLKQLREQQYTVPLTAVDYFGRWDPDPEDRLLIEGCMQILTDEERQIVVLHAVAGFKFREVGSHLGQKTDTVKTKYRRAIQKLKNSL